MKILISVGQKNNEYLLEEGRKENAANIIVKKVNDPDIQEILSTEILDNIIEADPTPNKKYIEWAARRMAEIARREEDDEYLGILKTFQDDPEGFAAFDNLPPERQELVRTYTDQQRIQSGYLTNAERLKSNREIIRAALFSRVRTISRSLKIYHKAAERGLMDKNIDKYKELYEWEHEVHKAEREIAERERMKQIEKGAKETTDYLHDDDDYMVVRPRSADSSCYYGRGTKWCISATQSRNYFDQYTGEGTGFYFVLFKHLPQQDPYKKLALVFTAGSYEPSEVFDVTDDEVGTDALTEASVHNVLGKGLKVAAADVIKRMKGENRVATYNTLFEDMIHEYDDFMQSEDLEGKDLLRSVFVALDFDKDMFEPDHHDLALEHISELSSEQEMDILGASGGHFEENPAGPTDADFDALHEQHKYDYVYVSYDMYDESRYYWDAGFSFDITEIHEDLSGADLDEVENVFRKILDENYVYPDEFDGYGDELSIRLQPDYDENEGLNGFENFLNRMDDVDAALHKIFDTEKQDTIQSFVEAGLIAGQSMKSLKERFDELELDNFEVDIEDKELSIYKSMQIVVPIPDRLYRGLTDEQPSWQTDNRANIGKSPVLQAYDAMIRQRTTKHSDELIKQIKTVFDRVFDMYVQKIQNTLPGFEREPKTQEQYGLLIPEYNVGIYRKSGVPQVGPSGLILGYFFDVRIEADEEETLEEENLKLIELFLKNIDKEKMLKKIQNRFETIVQNDTIKNIMPEFKEEGEEPEFDPIRGTVTSKAEREEAEQQRRSQAVDELSTMFENKKKFKILIKENVPFGGFSPNLAGNMSPNLGAQRSVYQPDSDKAVGKDLDMSAKIVLHRNSKVLLIKNHKGWDLPGGHIKEDENIISGLMREVFEETGLSLSGEDIVSLNMGHKNKRFFCGEFPTDDVQLSDEHYEYGFFTLEEVMKMKDIVDIYKKIIKKCMVKEDNREKIVIKIGHASVFQGAGPR